MNEGKPGRSAPDATRDAAFKRELVTLIPHLRAFARTLTGDPTAADDLAQDAMMKAWDARASFQMGTNMKAWTFMILRNQFYSEKRRSWRQSQLDQEAARSVFDEYIRHIGSGVCHDNDFSIGDGFHKCSDAPT